MAEAEGKARLQLCKADMAVVEALDVICSQLAICFDFSKNGLHGLSGLCGLPAIHMVWQRQRGRQDMLW